MPHAIVKLWAGKSEQQNHCLAQAITEDVIYRPHIVRKADTISVRGSRLTQPMRRGPTWPTRN